jgi:hypothetical protein
VILGLDSMVLDNDEALVRHGVRPTYKRVKGFQPLQMTWKGFVIDAVFHRVLSQLILPVKSQDTFAVSRVG